MALALKNIIEKISNKNVLVIGGAGFIGSHLVEGLLKEGANVFVADNLFLGKKENLPIDDIVFHTIDASDLLELRTMFRVNQRFDIVYNLAVLPLPHSLQFPQKNIIDNVNIIINLCNLLKNNFYEKLIHFSSSEVYGTARYTPMCESHPLESSTPYAASKAACDLICMSYFRTFNCPISIIRPFNNYGPRQNDGSYAGIIPLTMNRLKNGEQLEITGDGRQTRDFIYVEDTVRAAIMMGKRDDLSGEVFNVASGNDTSILSLVCDLSSEWAMQTGMDIKETLMNIRFKEKRIGDVDRHIGNILKAKDILRFEPSIRLEEGLRKTIEYYLKQNK